MHTCSNDRRRDIVNYNGILLLLQNDENVFCQFAAAVVSRLLRSVGIRGVGVLLLCGGVRGREVETLEMHETCLRYTITRAQIVSTITQRARLKWPHSRRCLHRLSYCILRNPEYNLCFCCRTCAAAEQDSAIG